MAIKERAALKNFFKTGFKPTQQNFTDLLDSYWHANDDVATQSWANSHFAPASGSGNYVQLNPAGPQVGAFNLTGGETSFLPGLTIDGGNVSIPDKLSFGTSNIVNIYRPAGGTDLNYNAYFHRFAGINMTIPNYETDSGNTAGAFFFNTVTHKFRGCNGSAWANLSTEDWVQAAAIQANTSPVPQVADFHLTGNGNFSGSYTCGLSVKYFHEGEPFSWAWYHKITPGGHFSGLNNGGSGIIGPSVYPAANSYINSRVSVDSANEFFATYVQPQDLGLRNSYTHIGYEAISFAYNDYVLSEASGFFAAVNNWGGGRGICRMIGSEHVVKNTDNTLISAEMQMIGMRAIADLNLNTGSNGIAAAGYFKATNGGTAKVHAIYSDGGSNYLKDGVETEAPSPNGAAAWKLGKKTVSPVTLDNSGYVEVMIGGQLVKLALANVVTP